MNKRPVVVRLNAITVPMTANERKILSAIDAEIIELEGAKDEEILAKCMEADAIMIVSAYLRTNVIQQLTNLKMISRLGIGTDKIDVEQATRQGIIVTNLPDVFTDEVADHTMALLLSAARQLKSNEALMRSGKRPETVKNMHRLSAQTFGIIGYGRIGRALAKRAKSFGLKILVNDPWVTKEQALQDSVELVDFETILANSDYLSLLCPLTASTREMIKMAELGKMKNTAILVNTGRGELVNEKDLAEALKTGVIRYAALDVFAGINVFTENGFPTDHPFFELDNVLLSPHVGASSEESFVLVTDGAAENVVAVLTGKEPVNIVNPSVNNYQFKITPNP